MSELNKAAANVRPERPKQSYGLSYLDTVGDVSLFHNGHHFFAGSGRFYQRIKQKDGSAILKPIHVTPPFDCNIKKSSVVGRHCCKDKHTGKDLIYKGSLTKLTPEAKAQAVKVSEEINVAEIITQSKTANDKIATPADKPAKKLKTTSPKKKRLTDDQEREMQQAFDRAKAQMDAGADPKIKGDLVKWYLNISSATLHRKLNAGGIPKPVKLPGGRTNYWKFSEVLNVMENKSY